MIESGGFFPIYLSFWSRFGVFGCIAVCGVCVGFCTTPLPPAQALSLVKNMFVKKVFSSSPCFIHHWSLGEKATAFYRGMVASV